MLTTWCMYADIHMTDLDYEKFAPTWRTVNCFLINYASPFMDFSSFITSGSLPTKVCSLPYAAEILCVMSCMNLLACV